MWIFETSRSSLLELSETPWGAVWWIDFVGIESKLL